MAYFGLRLKSRRAEADCSTRSTLPLRRVSWPLAQNDNKGQVQINSQLYDVLVRVVGETGRCLQIFLKILIFIDHSLVRVAGRGRGVV